MIRVHRIFSIIGILVILISVSFVIGHFIRSHQRTEDMSSPESFVSLEDGITPPIPKVITEPAETSDTWQSFKEVSESVWSKKDRGESLTNEDYQRMLDALDRHSKEVERRRIIRKRIVAEINREFAEKVKEWEADRESREQDSARIQATLARADAILSRIIRDENGDIIGLRGSHLSPTEISNTETSEYQNVPREESETISETTETPVGLSETNSGWHETLETQLSSLNRDIEDEYLNVIIAPYLSQNEFDEFFPTEKSRSELKGRQEQMQVDLAERVQRILSEDTENREEKLTYIREILSENWSEELADSIIERLR